LISRIVPHAEFAEGLRETIDWLRQTAPGARAALKRDINRHLPPIDDAMFAEGLASEECREGFRAFVEKRPPAWVRKPGPTGGGGRLVCPTTADRDTRRPASGRSRRSGPRSPRASARHPSARS